MRDITIYKLDHEGKVAWQYTGDLIAHEHGRIILQAYFDREDIEFQGMPLRKGDRFIETYFTDRWYNIFEIHAHDDGHLRGWYCNIGKPAILDKDTLSYVDLALDLLVFPDGRQIVLDEDEFEALPLDSGTRKRARKALEELKSLAFMQSPAGNSD